MKKKLLRGTALLGLAALLWIPNLHRFYARGSTAAGRQAMGAELLFAQRLDHGDVTRRDAERDRMREANAEWDFMGRTFFVLALANDALRHPEIQADALATIDAILEDTLRVERRYGQDHFLMGYAHASPWIDESHRSVFVDGEIAMMLAARQRLEASERWERPLRTRVRIIEAQMRRGPVMSAESYPDECWTFCNTLALAAIRVSDSVTGDDHAELLHGWLRTAQDHLIDPETGLLVSSFRHDGTPLDGPEGSSIFLAAHMLTLVDPSFARDQYERARHELGASFAGFGWAREWPASWEGGWDVDSGPIVPIVDASAGASGMAILGAAAFDDEAWLAELSASLELAAFPRLGLDGLRFRASNQVGDAVMAYALVQGPLFERVGPAPSESVAYAPRRRSEVDAERWSTVVSTRVRGTERGER
ncbi:MAG: hypothetical protein AB7S26_28620 [Sandaracinaceae bacterium]